MHWQPAGHGVLTANRPAGLGSAPARCALSACLLSACVLLWAPACSAASIQTWEDSEAIHLSNTDQPQLGADVLEDLHDLEAPLVSVRAPIGASVGGEQTGIGRDGPDIRRLVAHDRRTAERLAQFAPMVSAAARRHGVNGALLHAVVAIESAYNPSAHSRRGAIGLMQVMPATAARYGVRNLEDPLENLRAGCLYLRDLLDLFHQDVSLAVAAYNAGENAVIRHGNQIPPYPETARYVPQVIGIYRSLL